LPTHFVVGFDVLFTLGKLSLETWFLAHPRHPMPTPRLRTDDPALIAMKLVAAAIMSLIVAVSQDMLLD
jgi:hypothetical protein